MKVTSKTPLYKIIEAVKEQFGVNIDYDMAKWIRHDLCNATMEWIDERLGDNFRRLFRGQGIQEITRERVVFLVDGNEQVFITEAWNELHPPVELRRKPSWYVVVSAGCTLEPYYRILGKRDCYVIGPFFRRKEAEIWSKENWVGCRRVIITYTEMNRDYEEVVLPPNEEKSCS
jgi:hypothetical protein